MSDGQVVAVVVVWLALALVPALIARRKGQGFWTFYVFGLLLWIVAVPVALLVRTGAGAAPSAPNSCAMRRSAARTAGRRSLLSRHSTLRRLQSSACGAYPVVVDAETPPLEREPVDPPPLMQTLFEVLARQLGMGEGRATLEVRFQDGRFKEAYRHTGPIGPGALRRLEEPSPS